MYKDIKFKTKKDFLLWRTKMTKYIVEFDDNGQDFLVWYIHESGEIIDSTPFQASVWNGKMVITGSLEVGGTLIFDDYRELVHQIKRVTTIESR